MKLLLQAGAIAALVTLAVPAVGSAAYSQTTTHYTTAMTELYGSSAPFSGTLDLTIGADGIVGGHYFPADGAMFVPVVGGITGDTIWFDIGDSGSLHFSGRFKNDTIVGTAFDKGNTQYTFVANPSAPEQR